MFRYNFIKILSKVNRIHECELVLIKQCPDETITYHTLYFYCKKSSYLITIESTSKSIETLIGNNEKTSNNVYFTLINLIKLFKAKIIKIVIFNSGNCHLSVECELKKFQIHTALEDALIIAKLCNCKMYITENLLNDLGIKITKELLGKALNTKG